MSKLFTKRNTKVGAKPGTLMIAKEAQLPRIRIIRYTPRGTLRLNGRRRERRR